MPVIIKSPAIISSFEMFFLFISGSNKAVNNVMEERHTKLTGTVANLIEAKKNIQWQPTRPPVTNSLKKVFRLTLKALLLTLKYKNKDTAAISTLYQTNCTAAIDINAPSMPVKPHINTVKCSINKFLLMPAGVLLAVILFRGFGKQV
jgi:hypothetical protein